MRVAPLPPTNYNDVIVTTLGRFPEGFSATTATGRAAAAALQSHLDRISEATKAFTSPIVDDISRTALAQLDMSAVESALAKQMGSYKFAAQLADRQSNPVVFDHRPPMPKPLLVAPDSVVADLLPLVPEPPPWWKQSWVWGAFNTGLVLLGIIVALVIALALN